MTAESVSVRDDSAKKAAHAAYMRSVYKADPLAQSMRKFLARLRDHESFRPQLRTLEKLGLTIEMANDLRKEYGQPPIPAQVVRGRGIKTARMVLDKKVEPEAALASVIPKVTVRKDGPAKPAVVEVDPEDLKVKVDVDVVIASLSKKITSTKKLNGMRKIMFRVLNEMGYKEGESVVPYYNRHEKLIETVKNLKMERGGTPKPGTTLSYLHPFSSGLLLKDGCPPLIAQVKELSASVIRTTYTKWDVPVKKKRREEKDARVETDPDWVKDVRPGVKAFVRSSKNPLEERALAALYTQLGGVMRTGTALDLHVTSDLAKAEADRERNWLVLEKNLVTIISHAHKTGVSRGREKGSAVVLQLDAREQTYTDIPPKDIGGWLRQLAKGKDVLFPYEPYSRVLLAVIRKCLPDFPKVDMNGLRHSQETWVQAKGTIEQVTRATYVNAHTLATALDYYAGEAEGGDAPLAPPREKPKKGAKGGEGGAKPPRAKKAPAEAPDYAADTEVAPTKSRAKRKAPAEEPVAEPVAVAASPRAKGVRRGAKPPARRR